MFFDVLDCCKNARNEAKMPEKDFHQYCLISKIRSYDAAGSEVQRQECTSGT